MAKNSKKTLKNSPVGRDETAGQKLSDKFETENMSCDSPVILFSHETGLPANVLTTLGRVNIKFDSLAEYEHDFKNIINKCAETVLFEASRNNRYMATYSRGSRVVEIIDVQRNILKKEISLSIFMKGEPENIFIEDDGRFLIVNNHNELIEGGFNEGANVRTHCLTGQFTVSSNNGKYFFLKNGSRVSVYSSVQNYISNAPAVEVDSKLEKPVIKNFMSACGGFFGEISDDKAVFHQISGTGLRLIFHRNFKPCVRKVFANSDLSYLMLVNDENELTVTGSYVNLNEEPRVFKGFESELKTAILTEDNKKLITAENGEKSSKIKIFDVKTGEIIKKFDHAGIVKKVTVTEKFLIVASNKGIIYFYDINSFRFSGVYYNAGKGLWAAADFNTGRLEKGYFYTADASGVAVVKKSGMAVFSCENGSEEYEAYIRSHNDLACLKRALFNGVIFGGRGQFGEIGHAADMLMLT